MLVAVRFVWQHRVRVVPASVVKLLIQTEFVLLVPPTLDLYRQDWLAKSQTDLCLDLSEYLPETELVLFDLEAQKCLARVVAGSRMPLMRHSGRC